MISPEAQAKAKADARRQAECDRNVEMVFAWNHKICPKCATDLVDKFWGGTRCPGCKMEFPPEPASDL